MTTASHTPGPWEHDEQFIVAPDPEGIHPDIYIAEIVQNDGEGRLAPPQQQRANGALIAKAPALFDALLDIKRLAGKSDDRGYDPFTLLELIEERALTALSNVQQ